MYALSHKKNIWIAVVVSDYYTLCTEKAKSVL